MAEIVPELEDYEQFKADRMQALTSLDGDIFRSYMAKYNPDLNDIIDNMDDEQVLRSLHLARLGAEFMSSEDKHLSVEWLKERNYSGWEGILNNHNHTQGGNNE